MFVLYGVLLICVAFAVFCFVRGMHFHDLYHKQVAEVSNLRATVRELDNKHTKDLTAIDNLRFIVRQLEVERNGLLGAVSAQSNSSVYLFKLYDDAAKALEINRAINTKLHEEIIIKNNEIGMNTIHDLEIYRSINTNLHEELIIKNGEINVLQRRLDFYEPGDD